MRTTEQTAATTKIGSMIHEALDNKGASIRDLARHTESTYEHIRRILKGDNIPSKHVLKLICAYLGMDYETANSIATTDRVIKRYGGIPTDTGIKKPELASIENAWDHLTEDQKETLRTMANVMAKQNSPSKSA
jgi:transcriptional regulator with XRE-family HTH domain